MNDLELIKKFAELEGAEWRIDKVDGNPQVSILKRWKEGDLNCCCWVEFNPITDLALNCAARDKYNVTVRHEALSDDLTCCIVERGNGLSYIGVETERKESVPLLVIECILKSEGKL